MSSYKPPFARRLQRNTNVKPIIRSPKIGITTTTTTQVSNVSEAIEALGLIEEVAALEEITVAEVEVAEALTVEAVEEVEWSMKNTKKELLAAATDLGLNVSVANNKTEILAAIISDGSQ